MDIRILGGDRLSLAIKEQSFQRLGFAPASCHYFSGWLNIELIGLIGLG